jgi:hypothetical protein
MTRLNFVLRVIVLALALASLVLAASIVLSRWQAQLEQQQAERRNAGDIAMPLDASGTGSQTVDGVQITYRLAPYPARAGAASTLTVLALDLNSGQTRAITPTLDVAPLSTTASVTFSCQTDAGGAYSASGVFFPQGGDWRMRVRSQLLPNDSYVTVMVVNAGE